VSKVTSPAADAPDASGISAVKDIPDASGIPAASDIPNAPDAPQNAEQTSENFEEH
jgi:hypothetical protein